MDEEKGNKQVKDLDRMTVKELREVAAEIEEIVGVHAMKKAELLAAIKKAKGIKEKKIYKKSEKGTLTTKGLKRKILDLKKKREEARKARDKRSLNIIRRRISRTKKMTRKISKA